jgi:hypothetical protein
VLNLPDNIGGKKKDDSGLGGAGYSLNNDIINDMKKKNLLNRINSKFSAEAQKPELQHMKLVPNSSQGGGGQKELTDDELSELLNEAIPEAGIVQANWNIRPDPSLRETTFVPTTDDGFEDDYDNYRVEYNNYHGGAGKAKKNVKMGTIREEAEEEHKSIEGCSDTGYFSHEEGDFNSRDQYDSQEEEEFRKRQQQLLKGAGGEEDDDEDNRPYDEDNDDEEDNQGFFSSQDEAKRVQEEFGEGDEEEEGEAYTSTTMGEGSVSISQSFQAE